MKLLERYREAWSNRQFPVSLSVGVIVFCVAMAVNFYAVAAATQYAGSSVPDIILSQTPVYEVDGLFVYGTLVVALAAILVVFSRPKRIPFGLLAVGLFIFIRSAFTLMTHLGAPEAHYASDFGERITNAFFGSDQFFSAHTGMPFLGVLAFWSVPRYRYALLAASLFFAAVVLLGHIHYTIDVASAFFITYGIFHIAQWAFAREWRLFAEELK